MRKGERERDFHVKSIIITHTANCDEKQTQPRTLKKEKQKKNENALTRLYCSFTF